MSMKIKDDIRPVSYIKANTANVLNQVNETHRPVIITQNGEAKAVLIDTESYDAMQNALGILKLITMGEKDIKDNRITTQDVFFSSLEKKIKNKK